jgi:hypothetical protein
MQMSNAPTLSRPDEHLRGLIERVTFHSADTGFSGQQTPPCASPASSAHRGTQASVGRVVVDHRSNPVALREALEEGIAAHKAKVAAWRREQERQIRCGARAEPPDDEEPMRAEELDDDLGGAERS